MFNEYVAMTTLVILSIVLFPLTATNALAISNQSKFSDVDLLDVQHENYTIKDDNVLLQSIVGQIEIPIPDNVKSELNNAEQQTSGKLRVFSNSDMMYENVHSSEFADFFECNNQAQLALSTHSDNYRNWEAFFKRNTIDDTMAVRYCCNLLEYIQNAEDTLLPQCRDQVRLQDHVMIIPKISHTCRQYEFYNAQCFLVRWMYWWIPCLALVLIAFVVCICCWTISCRRDKRYLRPSEAEEKSHRKSLVVGVRN